MGNNSDQFYIEKVLNGETDAFAILINRYKNMAYTIAIKIVKNNEDAEEIAQDSFLKAFEKLDSFKGNSKFSTWLYTIVYRKAISKVRIKKVETTHIDDFIITNHASNQDFEHLKTIKNKEQEKYIKKAMGNLLETEALLITLYYLNENTVEEIEEITGFTRSNIKVKIFRARKKLYKQLTVLLKGEVKEII